MRTNNVVIRPMLAWLTILCALSIPALAQQEKNRSDELQQRAKIYEPVMAEMAGRNGIDSRLLWTIAYLESRFRPQLVSSKGARGMMQFMPGTAARYNLANPHDARESIEAASRYLHDLTIKFGNRVDLILAAYNAGEGAVESYRSGAQLVLANGKVINPTGLATGGIPPYRETRNYVANGIRIFSSLAAGKHDGPEPHLMNAPGQVEEPSAGEEKSAREDSYYLDSNPEQSEKGVAEDDTSRAQILERKTAPLDQNPKSDSIFIN